MKIKEFKGKFTGKKYYQILLNQKDNVDAFDLIESIKRQYKKYPFIIVLANHNKKEAMINLYFVGLNYKSLN